MVMAAKRQKSRSVALRTMVTPSQKGSILEALIVTNNLEGLVRLFKAPKK